MHANEDIAKALGWRLSDEPMDWFNGNLVFQKMHTRCWIDQAGAVVSCGEKFPDFTLPEWLPAIKERVRGLWCKDTTRWIKVELTEQAGVSVYLAEVSCAYDCGYTYAAHYTSSTEQAAFIDALLWLAGKRGKDD